jgi:DNA-binding LacI/PurR family transcriptional regulator
MASQGKQGVTSARQLASKLGLSVATVSRALNNHPDVAEGTRIKVLRMADSAGYMPRVGRKPTNVIGLVYPTDPVRADYGNFESAMLAGILEGVNEQRFDVTIINFRRDRNRTESCSQFLRAKGVRGVIVREIDPGSRLAEEIADDGFPCAVIADRSEHPGVHYICSDSRSDSMRAVQHLIHLGHRRIGLGVHSVLDSDHRDRQQGYIDAMTEAGLERDPTLMLRAPASMEGGASCITRFLSLPEPPTAIYFTDPLTTVGALHRCLVLGIRVPEQLSVVGFDDGDVRYRTFPHYTAVCQDAARMGRDAARWLTRALAVGDDVPSFRVHLPTSLSINDSTGAPSAEPVRISHNGTRARAVIPK